ncbi:hypothetical protein BYT27DRAFT_6399128 [Phlegmacium glaucopus]|nr:hypothetical protein BYT27DRAFT_6399128 [Phlegmacium glaucopus]
MTNWGQCGAIHRDLKTVASIVAEVTDVDHCIYDILIVFEEGGRERDLRKIVSTGFSM